jgi:uncharacterized membrane protein YfcA
MLSGTELALAGLAAGAAGLINALAGGGTLISFPTLIAIGVPDITANITSTVALCPGYLGGSLAQREDLAGQGRRLWLLLPAGILGGIMGGVLLVFLTRQVFHVLVPFLILLASTLLAVQGRARDWILRHPHKNETAARGVNRAILPIGITAVYGGYFGAGQSIIILSVLGLLIDDTLTRLNALRQCITLSSNVAAAVFFLFSGMILWPLVVIMAAGALAGGAVGGRFAGRINPSLLRWTVVSLGIVVGIILLVRL